MVALSKIHAELVDAYGDEIGGQGVTHKELERTPSGIFPLDLALGGGIPRGRVTMIYGAESSCKTTLALRLIAEHQKRWPDQACVFFDVENALDLGWAAQLGVDMKKLYLERPLYAEQCANMFVKILGASDVGIMVLDSVAAMNTSIEMEKDLEKAIVGNRALLMERLSRKITTRLIEHNRNPDQVHMPTVIYVNQVRTKIGVMFGDPETTPGGTAIRFQSTMIIRLFAKNVIDAKVSTVLPAWKKVSAVVRKWKVPILATHSEWHMAGVDHSGLVAGQSDDWRTAREYLKGYDLLVKAPGDKWQLLGETFNKQDEIRARMLSDPAWSDKVLGAIFEAASQPGTTGKVGVVEPGT